MPSLGIGLGLGYQAGRPPRPPVAAFTGSPVVGTRPLSVTFTNTSTFAASYSWEKNDGSGWVPFAGTPTATNPTESFDDGTWSVRLTATGAGGSNALTRSNYITSNSDAVEFTVNGSTAFASTPYEAPTYAVSKVYDDDGGTFFAAADTNNGYVGFDAGSGKTITPTGLWLYPRSTGDGHEIRLTTAVIEQADTPAGAYTQVGTVARYLAPGAYTYVPITGAAARRCVRVRRDGEYCDVAEFRVEGNAAAGVGARRPCRPRFSNPGPR